MQNKPNLREAQMNVSAVTITNYEEIWPHNPRKNKPNSNPNKPNSNPDPYYLKVDGGPK